VKNPTSTPISKSDVKHLHSFVPVKPSKRLLAFVTLVHLLAILSFLNTGLALVWVQIPIVLLCIHLGRYWHHWRCLPTYTLRRLKQQWCLFSSLSHISKIGETSENRLTVVACHYWSNFLVVLIVENKQSRQQYIPILPDSSKDFRRIKVISKTMLSSE